MFTVLLLIICKKKITFLKTSYLDFVQSSSLNNKKKNKK